MSVYKRKGETVYSYDFRWRGARFSGSTGCEAKREAKRVEDRIRAEAKAVAIDRSKPMTFAVASSLYWDEVGSFHNNADDTERALAWLQGQIGKAKLIATISDADVAKAVAKRRGETFRDEPITPSTVNRSVTVPLRAILRRARRTWKQTVQDIEWKDHLLPEPQERVREATPDEEDAFEAAIRDDYLPALRFAFLTGCRRGEIVGLEWSKVDFFNRFVTVTGKRDRTRKIPLTDETFQLLWDLKDDHPTAVFTYKAKKTRDGRERGARYPITDAGFKTEWRRKKEKAGVQDFRFHDTRHTAATRLVRATGNLKLAQRLLGHSELATTSRYSHVTDADLRAGLEASSPTKNATSGPEGTDKALKNNG
jgi:integrase